MVVCGDDGRWARHAVETCDPAAGQRCQYGRCADLCAEAAQERSYVGCEYWPTVTRSSQIVSTFDFAVAVANSQPVPVDVSVRRGDEVVAQHREDGRPFGITVSGLAPYTSYLYPGGLDLEQLFVE